MSGERKKCRSLTEFCSQEAFRSQEEQQATGGGVGNVVVQARQENGGTGGNVVVGVMGMLHVNGVTLHPTPYTLHPTSYTLNPTEGLPSSHCTSCQHYHTRMLEQSIENRDAFRSGPLCSYFYYVGAVLGRS